MKLKIFNNKKGVFMTIIAIIITSFLVFIFSAQIENPVNYQQELVKSRVESLNYYSDDFYDYVESISKVSGYFALVGVINDLDTRQVYNPNFYKEYPNCLVNGNLTATRVCPGMQNKTLSDQIELYKQLALNELKINTEYTINNITVSQTQDPFLVDIYINISVQVSDVFANITSNRILTSQVNIVGLKDPLYVVNGTYTQRIKKGNITKREGTWSPEDLEEIYTKKQYRVSSDGISFVNRIMGNFTNSSLGIESIIDYNASSVQPLITPSSSFVDYLFWTNVQFNCVAFEVVQISPTAVPSMPDSPSLQLDEKHRLIFGIDNSDTSMTNSCS